MNEGELHSIKGIFHNYVMWLGWVGIRNRRLYNYLNYGMGRCLEKLNLLITIHYYLESGFNKYKSHMVFVFDSRIFALLFITG